MIISINIRMNFCFAVANNVLPVEGILEMHNFDNAVTEAACYNTSIWCHDISRDLKIFLENLIEVNKRFTWMKCFTQGCRKMTKVDNLR